MTENNESQKIVCETDKRVNIYNMWDKNQIMLCKKTKRPNDPSSEGWTALWPTENREKQMIDDKIFDKSKDFVLSPKGKNYLKSIQGKVKINKYIAKVEFHTINKENTNLWEELKTEKEFDIWDPEGGPVSYFLNHTKECYIAIYKVYEIDYEITEDDLEKTVTGNIKRVKTLTWEAFIQDLRIAARDITNYREL